MRDKNFTTSFLVDQSPEEVFNAVNNVRGWWSGEIYGDTDKLDAVFEYRYQELHRSVQKITEFAPGKRVVWHIVDGHLNFVRDGEQSSSERAGVSVEESPKRCSRRALKCTRYH
jgi:hypothetical protein